MAIINKQTEANKRWQEKNKEYSNYLKDRSKTRSFIRNKANEEDLKELLDLINDRINDRKILKWFKSLKIGKILIYNVKIL